jgi:AcrR family transcriptional regulator|tara:strand:- start:117 stop:782 length:666 start_codon:yes stop_codon:yes gene_type:complete
LQRARSDKVVVTKQNRRATILQQARRLLANADDGAFSLRKLAEAANVTVPTIYNLIGGKFAILLALQIELVQKIEDSLVGFDDDHALEMAEAIVISAVDMISEDENYYRASLIASDKLMQSGEYLEDGAKLGQRAAAMQTLAIRKAQKTNQLRGTIDATLLGRLIFRHYQHTAREWMYRLISQEQFRNRALLGIYICLMADANDSFRELLVNKIAGVSQYC